MESYHPGGGVPSTENIINDFKTLGNIWKLSLDVLQGDNFANSNKVDHNIDLYTDFEPRRYRQCENLSIGGENLTFSNRLNLHGGVVERNDSHVASYPYGRIQPTSIQNRVWPWSESRRHESLIRPVAIYPEENHHYLNTGEGQTHTFPSSNSETLTRSEGQRSNSQYFPPSNEQYQVYVNGTGQPYHGSAFPIVTEYEPRLHVPEQNNCYQFQPITQQSSQGSHQTSIQCKQVPKKRKPRFQENIDTTPSTNSVPSTSTSVPSEPLNLDGGNPSSSFTVSLPGGVPLFTIPLVGQATSGKSLQGKATCEEKRPLVKKKKSRTVVYRSESYKMENLRKPRLTLPVSPMDIPNSNINEPRLLPSPVLLNYNGDSDSEAPKSPKKTRLRLSLNVATKQKCKMCSVCKKPKWRNKVSRATGKCKCKGKSQVAPKPQVSGGKGKQVFQKRSSSKNGGSNLKCVSNPALPKSRSSVEILCKRQGRKNQRALRERSMEVEIAEEGENSQDMGLEQVNEIADHQQSSLDMPDIFQLFQSTDSSTVGERSNSSTDGVIIDCSTNELSGNITSIENELECQEMPHSSNTLVGCCNGERVSEGVESQLSTMVTTSSSDDEEVAEYLSGRRITESSGKPADQNFEKTCSITGSIEAIAHANNAQRIHSACFSDISDDNNRVNDQLVNSLSEGEIVSDDETLEIGNNFGESGHFSHYGNQVATTQHGTTTEVYHHPGNAYTGMLTDYSDIEHPPQQENTCGEYAMIPGNGNDQWNIFRGPRRVYDPFHSLSFRPQLKVTYNGDLAPLSNIFYRGHYDSKMIALQENEDRYNDMNICITPAHQQETSHLRDFYQNIGPRGQCNTGPFAHLHQLFRLTMVPPSSNHSPFENQSNGNPWQLQIPETQWNEGNYQTFGHGTVTSLVGHGAKTIPNQLDSNRIREIRGTSGTSQMRDTPVYKRPKMSMSGPGSAVRDESFLRSKGRICKFDEEGIKTVTRIAHKILSETKGTSESLKQLGRKCHPGEPSAKSSPQKRVTSKSVKSDVVPPARLGKMLKKFATAVGRKQNKVSRIQERLMEDVQKVYKLGSPSGSGSDTPTSKTGTPLRLKEVSISIPGPFERRLRSKQKKNSTLPAKQAEQGSSRIGELKNCTAEMSPRVAAPCSTDGNDKIDISQSDTSNSIPMQRNRTPVSDDDDILSLHADTSLDDIL